MGRQNHWPRLLGLAAIGWLSILTHVWAQRQPNVIYVLADDLGYGELGCYGQRVIETPNIDRLAAEGIRFTQHYAGAPVCAPSRCVLMTGLHTGHAYIRDNREHNPEGQLPIPAETLTLAERLKQFGYATAAIGKWGLGFPGSSGDPNRQGFDLFFGYNCQRHAHNHFPRYLWRNDQHVDLEGNTRSLSGQQFSQDLFTREAIQFIRDHAEMPFFLYMPLTIPHLSIQVPEVSLARYQGKIPEAEYDHRDGYLKHPFPRSGYAAMISHMDQDIGKVLDVLDELGLADDTLFMFSSDNGPTYDRLGGSDSDFFESSGPLRGRKGSVYEGGIRVPLVARWPGQIQAGRESDLPCAFWDLVSTLVEATGGKVPTDVDGISFLPTLLGRGDQARHEYLVWHFPAYGGQQAIRLGRWKGVRRNLLKTNKSPLELYDLSVDLSESRDVAAEQPEVVARMTQILRDTQIPSEYFPILP